MSSWPEDVENEENLKEILDLFPKERPRIALFSNKRTLQEFAENIYRVTWLLENYKAEIPIGKLEELYFRCSHMAKMVRKFTESKSLILDLEFKISSSKDLWEGLSTTIAQAIHVSVRSLLAEAESNIKKERIINELHLLGVSGDVVVAINSKLLSIEHFLSTNSTSTNEPQSGDNIPTAGPSRPHDRPLPPRPEPANSSRPFSSFSIINPEVQTAIYNSIQQDLNTQPSQGIMTAESMPSTSTSTAFGDIIKAHQPVFRPMTISLDEDSIIDPHACPILARPSTFEAQATNTTTSGRGQNASPFYASSLGIYGSSLIDDSAGAIDPSLLAGFAHADQGTDMVASTSSPAGILNPSDDALDPSFLYISPPPRDAQPRSELATQDTSAPSTNNSSEEGYVALNDFSFASRGSADAPVSVASSDSSL